MARTKFERLEIGGPDVAVFRISGKLGFHENNKIQRLTEECLKRELKRVIFDFSGLTSLGGGVAKILRDFAGEFGGHAGVVEFVVTNDIVLQFLQDDLNSFPIHPSLDDALGTVGVAPSVDSGCEDSGPESDRDGEPAGSGGAPETALDDNAAEHDVELDDKDVILMSYDGDFFGDTLPAGKTDGDDVGQAEEVSGNEEINRIGAEGEEVGIREEKAAAKGSTEIFSEIFGEDTEVPPPDWIEKPTSPFEKSAKPAENDKGGVEELNRRLKRRILELNTLFAISTDFGAIRDKKKLLDIFLLTSIAQGGVESAAFFEKRGDVFELVISKGLDSERVDPLRITSGEEEEKTGENKVLSIDDYFMKDSEREALRSEGLENLCLFHQEGSVTGLVLLGRRIAGRGRKREDFDFLRILVNIAQGAYENAVMFEREHERTLGIVKSLISMIEENTLLKGTSEFVSRYVGLVAKNMGYPDEWFKDLIYATVLRDMGMIKVSDLIVRSPRELTQGEWEVIKKHPEDGAEMLKRMKFNDTVVEIVKCHHERFNGEGYPNGLRGREIPSGSRIISVVESYAAMISERPNRPAFSDKEALEILKENYGLRYDREVVSAFTNIMEKELARSISPEVSISREE